MWIDILIIVLRVVLAVLEWLRDRAAHAVEAVATCESDLQELKELK